MWANNDFSSFLSASSFYSAQGLPRCKRLFSAAVFIHKSRLLSFCCIFCIFENSLVHLASGYQWKQGQVIADGGEGPFKRRLSTSPLLEDETHQLDQIGLGRSRTTLIGYGRRGWGIFWHTCPPPFYDIRAQYLGVGGGKLPKMSESGFLSSDCKFICFLETKQNTV